MHDGLGDAEVARRDALVEAAQSVRLVDPLDALSDAHLAVGVVIQLQARLHEPDRVGGRRGDETGTKRTQDVREWRVGRQDAMESDKDGSSPVRCVEGAKQTHPQELKASLV